MKSNKIKISTKKNIMGRPPPSWILELHRNKLIKDDELYTKEFLSKLFEKHPRTISDVIENAYLKLYGKNISVIREANNMHVIIKYQGELLRKLSKDYAEFIDENKKRHTL